MPLRTSRKATVALAFVTVIALHIACGPKAEHRRMMMYGEVQPDAPYVVALGRYEQGVFTATCSGVAIAPDRVLTAGHCVAACGPVTLWVTDALDVARGSAEHVWRASRAVRHPRYVARPTQPDVNDLAILEVPGASLTAWPERYGEFRTDVLARKIGYGFGTTGTGEPHAGLRLGANVKLIAPSPPVPARFRFTTSAMVCLGDSGGGSFALDDRGNPALLVGLTSEAISPIDIERVACSAEGVDVPVLAYRTWIQRVLKGECNRCGDC